MSEADIKTKFILPSIEKAGWDRKRQIREEVYFTPGRIRISGKLIRRGDPKKADYISTLKK